MIINLSDCNTRLLGKTAGRKGFAYIGGRLSDVPAGELVYLDFAEVEIVNGSWLNTAIAPTYRWAAEPQVDLFPVLINFPWNCLDELELVAQVNGQCYPLVDQLTEPLRSATLVGNVDGYLKETLQALVNAGGSATGADLARTQSDTNIQATAWNNRLKELHDKRLLVRRKEGRQQIYSPLAREVKFDG